VSGRVEEEENDENQWGQCSRNVRTKGKKKKKLEAKAYTEVEQEEQGGKRKEKKMKVMGVGDVVGRKEKKKT
jgi:hypothetical protein